MAARYPVLLISVGVAALTATVMILLHWLLLLEGRGLGLPCYAIFWPSYTCEGVLVFCMVARNLRESCFFQFVPKLAIITAIKYSKK